MIRIARVAALALAAAGAAAPAPAQPGLADAREIAAYRLTTDGFNKVLTVNRVIFRAVLEDPKAQESMRVAAEIEALEKKDELTAAETKRLAQLETRQAQLRDAIDNPLGGDVATLAEMEARIRRFPPMLQALEREKMTPREYATFWMAFLQASLSHGFQKAGMMKELPPDVSPANVQFVADHQAEIQAMQKEFAALGRRQQ